MQAIPTQTFLTDVPETSARVLAYEPRGPWRSRQPLHTRWGKAALAVAALTSLYTAACAVGMFRATGWDGLGWLVWGFFGNWIGGGAGVVLALMGLGQRSRRRALAVHAIWVNLVVVAVPLILVVIPYWLK